MEDGAPSGVRPKRSEHAEYSDTYCRRGFEAVFDASRATHATVDDLDTNPGLTSALGRTGTWKSLLEQHVRELVTMLDSTDPELFSLVYDTSQKDPDNGYRLERGAKRTKRAGVDLYRMSRTVKIKPEEFLALMLHLPTVGSFDDTLLFIRTLHHFDHQTFLTHSCNAPGFLVRHRDFSDIIHYRHMDDGSILYIDVGVPQLLSAFDDHCYRGEVIFFGYRFAPTMVSEAGGGLVEGTRVTLVNQTVLNGWMPGMLVNRFVPTVIASYLVNYEREALKARANGRMDVLLEMVHHAR